MKKRNLIEKNISILLVMILIFSFVFPSFSFAKENDIDNSNQSINEDVVLTDENNNINEDKTTQEENVEDNKVEEDNNNKNNEDTNLEQDENNNEENSKQDEEDIQIGNDYESNASSWRYQNGYLIDSGSTYMTRSASTAWTKVNGNFVNNKGKVIKGAKRKGIDVSSWQGNIDWNKVKKSDIDFVIIRCGYGSDIKSQDDSKWERNVEECERLGIPYGVYIYSYANTDAKAKSEAAHVLRLLKGHTPQYPVYYDLEDSVVAATGKTNIIKRAEIFCSAIEDAGYTAGIYANLDWWNNKLNSSSLDKYKKWVAQWNSECTYKKDFQLWQCADNGTVPGISGRVDINFDFDDIKTTVNYSPYRYTDVKADTKLRSGSGTTYDVIDTIPKGTRLLTYGYDKYNGTDAWYKVKYGDKTGYVSNDDVKLSYQAYSPKKKGLTTTKMYMRSGVGLSNSNVKLLAKGSKIYVLGYYRVYGTDWYKITSGDQTGYVSSKYVDLVYGWETKTVNYSPYRYTDAKNATKLISTAESTGSVLTTVPKGTRLLTYGYVKYDGVETWYKVKYGDKIGYVTNDDVKLSYQAYSPKKKGLTTTKMYMRSGIGLSNSKVKLLAKGSKVYVLGYYRVYGTDWYKITYGGKTGYVSGKYVKQVYAWSQKTVNYSPDRYTDVKKSTNLRSTAKSTGSVVTTIPKGTRLLTYGYVKYDGAEAWYKVKYGSKTGYVSNDDVKLSYQAYSPKKKGVTTTKMYMRSGVGLSNSKVKLLKKGSSVYVLGYYRVYGTDWYKITSSGKTGYVSSKYVKF